MNELGIICDGSVLIRNGRLAEVGPTRRVENLALARDAIEIDATGCVVMPGLIDAHTHLVCPQPAAGGADDAGETGPEDGRAIRALTAKRLEAVSRRHVEEMIRHGTTTLEAKTGCCADEAAEMKLLRVLGALDGAPVDVIATHVVRIEDDGPLLEKIRHRGLARFVDLQGCRGREAEALRVLEYARRLGFLVSVHAGDAGARGLWLAAAEAGAVSVSHLEHASDDDIAVLAGSGTMATLVPAASFRERRPYAAGRHLVDAGVPVALGTNFNPLLTPTLSM